jgi:ABC-2 type transport system ATP-binding protein
MKDILRKLCNEGTTVFVSTHILEIAERMCDRFAIINRGKIVAVGTMAELRAHAASDTKSLEDIFLDLTSGDEYRDLIQYLG